MGRGLSDLQKTILLRLLHLYVDRQGWAPEWCKPSSLEEWLPIGFYWCAVLPRRPPGSRQTPHAVSVAMTRALARLEKRGLVERQQCTDAYQTPSGKWATRGGLLILTPAGLAAAKKLMDEAEGNG